VISIIKGALIETAHEYFSGIRNDSKHESNGADIAIARHT
jgi:hypothetical protein